MPEPFEANVQYNDLKGAIAIDGHTGGFVGDLAKKSNMPDGYRPVGFQMWNAIPYDDGSFEMAIVAVRSAQVGESFEDMLKYAEEHGELPVCQFDLRIDFAKFCSLMKRLDIKVLVRGLEHLNVVSYSGAEM